jgi:hypothetical protein
MVNPMASRGRFSRKASAVLALSWVVLIPSQGCGAHTCSSNADCSGSDVCSFMTGDCSGKGTCTAWDNQCAGPPTQACGCDGTTLGIECGYPANPVPVKALGACAVPAGGACSGSSDCDPRALCAFALDAGCSAQGVCVAPDVTCTDTTSPAACACDGTPVGLACIFGAGNAPLPVRSTSPCPAADGGSDAAPPDGSDAPPD